MKFPKTLQEFQAIFPDEEACWSALRRPLTSDMPDNESNHQPHINRVLISLAAN